MIKRLDFALSKIDFLLFFIDGVKHKLSEDEYLVIKEELERLRRIVENEKIENERLWLWR